jgi:hypothetical protein
MKNRNIISIIVVLSISIGFYLNYPWKQKCAPYRTLIGCNALCVELNSVRNCAQLLCKGGSVTLKKTKLLLENANGSGYLFQSNLPISVTDQNQIITQANIWATANAPTGYSVNYIKFIPDLITSTPTISHAGVDIEVQYRMCTGSLPK